MYIPREGAFIDLLSHLCFIWTEPKDWNLLRLRVMFLRIDFTKLSFKCTFTLWNIISPAPIVAFLHISSHHLVTREAAVSYFFTVSDHVTCIPTASDVKTVCGSS